jgi:hypothetical protein
LLARRIGEISVPPCAASAYMRAIVQMPADLSQALSITGSLVRRIRQPGVVTLAGTFPQIFRVGNIDVPDYS